MNVVGYLLNTKDGLIGDRGMAYDYVIAKNGVFVESEGKYLAARVPVALAARSFYGTEIRGLEPTGTTITLRYGKIPAYIFNLAISHLMGDRKNERFAAVTFAGGYHVNVPEQTGKQAHVEYAVPENVVLDLHSHPTFSMAFSGIDDADEQGFHLYGVLAEVDSEMPTLHLRVGVYGYWSPIKLADIVDGEVPGILDGYENDMAEGLEDDWEEKFAARLEKATEILKEHRRNIHDDESTNATPWWRSVFGRGHQTT
jgi:PRTRC genetic system protein A